jgi:hypothetical protein
VYAYIGDMILKGYAPYKDAWDVKSPGIFFQFAAAFALFGRTGFAANLMDGLIAVLAAWALFSVGERWRGWRAGLFAAVSWVLLYFAYVSKGWDGQPETTGVLLVSWLMLLGMKEAPFSRWESVTSGLICALLLWYKLPFIVFGALLLPRLRRSKVTWGVIWPALAAFLGVAALFVGYFASKGALADLYEGAVLFPLRLATLEKGDISTQSANFYRELYQIGRGATGPVVFALIGLLVLAATRVRGREILLTMFALGIGLLLVVGQGRYFAYHWLLALPSVSLLAGIGVDSLARWAKSRSACLAACMMAAVLLSVFPARGEESPAHTERCIADTSAFLWSTFSGTYLRTGEIYDYWARVETNYGEKLKMDARTSPEFGRILREETNEDESILCFDIEPSINFYAERRAPTRFLYLWYLGLRKMQDLGWYLEFARGVMAKKPKFIVVCKEYQGTFGYVDGEERLAAWPELGAWFKENYLPVVDMEVGVMKTFIHKDAVQ